MLHPFPECGTGFHFTGLVLCTLACCAREEWGSDSDSSVGSIATDPASLATPSFVSRVIKNGFGSSVVGDGKTLKSNV